MHSFFDESGKLNDKRIVAFGGVGLLTEHLREFQYEWAVCLKQAGLPFLKMSEALKSQFPLSNNMPAIGASSRIEALLPFISCIRKKMDFVTGVAVDAEEFKKFPDQFKEMFKNDPVYLGFLRGVLSVLNLTPDDDHIGIMCDDEEATAGPMLQYYRKIKMIDPVAKKKLWALCFGDDEGQFGIQAADMVSSLLRLETEKDILGREYDYSPLYAALSAPRAVNEQIKLCDVFKLDKEKTEKLMEELRDHRAAPQSPSGS